MNNEKLKEEVQKTIDALKKDVLSDKDKLVSKAEDAFYKKPWFYVAIVAGVILVVGLILGRVIF